MNVLTNLVPANADTVKLADKRDRGGASKQNGSGFSDVLGAVDERAQRPASTDQAEPRAVGTTSREPAPSSASADTGAQSQARQSDDKSPVAASNDGQGQAPTNDEQAPTGKHAILLNLVDLPKTVQTMPGAPAEQANTEETTGSLADLVTFIEAMTKAVGKAEAPVEDETTDTDSEKPADGDEADVATAPAGNGPDLMSLLAVAAAPTSEPVNPVQTGPQSKSSQGGALLPVEPSIEGEDAVPATVVRVSKADVPAIDLHIASHEDGSTKIDATLASTANLDVVQVLDSRRFLALAPTANTTNITAAMTSDPDWATAMAGQTAGAPLVTSTGQVVHTLKIQMSPVDLGHVTAALKLVGDELSVHLTAHTLKGYAELQKDGSAIVDALKSQGFSVENVTVSLATGTDRQDNSTNNRQSGDPGQQGAQQGSHRGNDERSQAQPQFYRQGRSNGPEEANGNDITVQPETPPRAAGARPGHVYL
ncbi:flagellar hook-length control protein FliK [uncultured Agrobacterium sp.]|uniref:flagellar hook-length control protein FliK n=1 Tax=uncultured Agrobacterium sp. TaxID=157277 RepID=UPI0025D605E6|nr:flagellar hook-length control protein FliK [uncultured Agrobacterium sp.]